MTSSASSHPSAQTGAGLIPLALAALGVVYGDIGTSPLYAFKEAFAGAHGIDPSEAHVLATLSAFFWAVLIVVSLKYVWVVLRFDNEGEGGVLALTALAHRVARGPRRAAVAVGAGIFAAALFYGDAIITPAISVLSAVEGLSVATPHLEHYVVPITVGILVALFMIQKHGTGQVGRYFGPVTVLWFVTLAVLGVASTTASNAWPSTLQPLPCAASCWMRRPVCSTAPCACSHWAAGAANTWPRSVRGSSRCEPPRPLNRLSCSTRKNTWPLASWAGVFSAERHSGSMNSCTSRWGRWVHSWATLVIGAH